MFKIMYVCTSFDIELSIDEMGLLNKSFETVDEALEYLEIVEVANCEEDFKYNISEDLKPFVKFYKFTDGGEVCECCDNRVVNKILYKIVEII